MKVGEEALIHELELFSMNLDTPMSHMPHHLMILDKVYVPIVLFSSASPHSIIVLCRFHYQIMESIFMTFLFAFCFICFGLFWIKILLIGRLKNLDRITKHGVSSQTSWAFINV